MWPKYEASYLQGASPEFQVRKMAKYKMILENANYCLHKKKKTQKKCDDKSNRQTKRNREAKSFVQNLMLRLINVIRLFICV